jgi:hypothetical protein
MARKAGMPKKAKPDLSDKEQSERFMQIATPRGRHPLERLRRERKRKADIQYVLPVLKDLRRRAGQQHEV